MYCTDSRVGMRCNQFGIESRTVSCSVRDEQMNVQSERRQVILILDDIEETRHLTEKMLGNKFCIMRAEGEEEAVLKARCESPNLILMSLGLELEQLIATAQRLRQNAALGEEVTVVIFCVPTIPEG